MIKVSSNETYYQELHIDS